MKQFFVRLGLGLFIANCSFATSTIFECKNKNSSLYFSQGAENSPTLIYFNDDMQLSLAGKQLEISNGRHNSISVSASLSHTRYATVKFVFKSTGTTGKSEASVLFTDHHFMPLLGLPLFCMVKTY
jgi:hypothetical protein